MPQSPIATAADYADAMIVARRAKNWLFGLLLIILLGQLAIFFAARYSTGLSPANATAGARAFAYLRYIVAIVDFLGVALAIVFSMLLMVLLAIMLIGRLIGVSRVTSALIWSLILIVLLFPWQSFLINPSLAPPVRAGETAVVDYRTASPATLPTTSESVLNPLLIPAGPSITMATSGVAAPASAPTVLESNAAPRADFKVPGVLYTWPELMHPTVGARFGLNTGYSEQLPAKILRWARYVAFPIIALLILLVIQAKSSRGLRLALGEADYDNSAPVAG